MFSYRTGRREDMRIVRRHSSSRRIGDTPRAAIYHQDLPIMPFRDSNNGPSLRLVQCLLTASDNNDAFSI